MNAAQVHAQRNTQGHQRKMKPDRRHSAASFPELITEGRPFLFSVLSFSCVFVSLPLFIFTAACTFWASHLLFAWLGFFSPPFLCVFFSIPLQRWTQPGSESRCPDSGPRPYKTAQRDIFSFSHFGSRCSSVGICVWTHFQSLYISKKDTTGGFFAETQMHYQARSDLAHLAESFSFIVMLQSKCYLLNCVCVSGENKVPFWQWAFTKVRGQTHSGFFHVKKKSFLCTLKSKTWKPETKSSRNIANAIFSICHNIKI